jgi:hypothetical protein
MVRIFLSAGHGAGDPGAGAGGTTEDREMRLVRDAAVAELRARGCDVTSVPDYLSLIETISWINDRSRRGDVALEIHADAYDNTSVRGASAYYAEGNEQRESDTQLLLRSLLESVSGLPSRGVKPDTSTGVGSLGFCRQISIPSILMELGFLTNPSDRALMQRRRKDYANGLADGLQAWSEREARRQGLTPPPPRAYPVISIKINGQFYRKQGILVNGNASVPVVFFKSLGIDPAKATGLRQVNYRNVAYVKAVDLQQFGVSVKWDNPNKTVILTTK